MKNIPEILLKSHSASTFLTVRSKSYQDSVLQHFYNSLKDDEGIEGDITTQSLEIGSCIISAQIKAKENGMVAGLEELKFFMNYRNKKIIKKTGIIHVSFYKKDGDSVRKNETIALLKGKAQDILSLERTFLNFIQRMSGIATLTATYVKKVPSNILIVPTRKTLWGVLDKKACMVAGGGTHRLGLYDAVLIKDTHLKILKNDFDSIFQRLKDYFAHAKIIPPKFFEIEVESPAQALKAIQFYKLFHENSKNHEVLRTVPFLLMFDNMKPRMISQTIALLKKDFKNVQLFFEASGGITLKNIQEYAKTGVHILSIGALTHSVKALDFSLKVTRIL